MVFVILRLTYFTYNHILEAQIVVVNGIISSLFLAEMYSSVCLCVWKLCFLTKIECMIHNILKTSPFYHLRLWLWVERLDNFSSDNSKKASKGNETSNTI